jgi:phosphoribosylcarboxyaminoimidazole (NCAIR) mutase
MSAPLVGIVMGSDSDLPIMRGAARRSPSSASRTRCASSPRTAPRTTCSPTAARRPAAGCA